MRVCTDATLFGAMAPVGAGDRVLDIGTGTGLLALMAAQLGAAWVIGVELTRASWEEARVNFRNSPWSERLRAVHADARGYEVEEAGRFDLVISNPPFFERHSRARAPLRDTARHTETLPHADLVAIAERSLTANGLFYVLLPLHAAVGFMTHATDCGFFLVYRTDIRGHAGAPAKVTALTLGRRPFPSGYRIMTIYASERVYSAESARYLASFLLRFADRVEPVFAEERSARKSL